MVFNSVTNIFNIVGGSCKQYDAFLENEAINILKAINDDEFMTGKGLN